MIHKNIVITEYKSRICTMLFEDNRLEDLHVEGKESILGDIYIAKVKNINKNINAAFVELADRQMAFLPLEDMGGSSFWSSVDKRLREGDELPVQVIKEGIKTKDPVVTTGLSLSGAYCVITLDKRKGGFQYSRKLSKEKKQDISSALTDCVLPKEYAVVIRTAAGQLQTYEELKEEIHSLVSEMDEILLKARSRTCFCRIYKKLPSYIEYLYHILDSGYEEVVTDLPEVFQILQGSFRANVLVRLYQDPFPLRKLYSVETKMEELFAKKIYLKSGASLFIEYTEAMTVIDVNTGKCMAKKEKDTLNYEINTEAAYELARHLRLRNISGIILVDFINMEKEQYKADLIRTLKSILKKDPVPCHYVDMTALGLVEITRKKEKKPIFEMF